MHIMTYTGKRVNPFALTAADIDIHDVAHALANKGRWGGHTKHFYSVAEHSVRCFMFALKMEATHAEAAWALLHDAHEAYNLDIPRPMRPHLYFDKRQGIRDLDATPTPYDQIETRSQRIIADAFDLPFPIPPMVHNIDDSMLYREAMDLMPPGTLLPNDANCVIPLPEPIKSTWLPVVAETEFLNAFDHILTLPMPADNITEFPKGA